MLNIFDRYLGKTIIKYVAMVVLVILFLDAFFTFLVETKYVQRHDTYSYADAVLFILFQLPSKLVELSPALVLIGCLMGMGALASNSELIAMRAAGLSKLRIILGCMKTGAILGVAVLLISQFVSPVTDSLAEKTQKFGAPSNHKVVRNFWSKNGDDFIHIGALSSEFALSDVDIYTVKDQTLLKHQNVQRANFVGGKWQLHNIKETRYSNTELVKTAIEQEVREQLIDADIYKTVRVEPQSLSITDLFRYGRYLRLNGLESSQYDRAFWKKLTQPLSILVMMFIAMPFVFAHQRKGNVGTRLVLGIMFGIGYYIISELFGNLGVVYHVPVLVSALLPVIVFSCIGFFLLRKQH